mgnify:CR=1 FL=1
MGRIYAQIVSYSSTDTTEMASQERRKGSLFGAWLAIEMADETSRFKSVFRQCTACNSCKRAGGTQIERDRNKFDEVLKMNIEK